MSPSNSGLWKNLMPSPCAPESPHHWCPREWPRMERHPPIGRRLPIWREESGTTCAQCDLFFYYPCTSFLLMFQNVGWIEGILDAMRPIQKLFTGHPPTTKKPGCWLIPHDRPVHSTKSWAEGRTYWDAFQSSSFKVVLNQRIWQPKKTSESLWITYQGIYDSSPSQWWKCSIYKNHVIFFRTCSQPPLLPFWPPNSQ